VGQPRIFWRCPCFQPSLERLRCVSLMETLLRETCFPPQGALLTGTDPVATFSCGGCSSHSELGKQYFCLNCRSTRCLSCVNSSVGASFCPQCMEIYVAEDARVFENKFVGRFSPKHFLTAVLPFPCTHTCSLLAFHKPHFLLVKPRKHLDLLVVH
jgi:hypothetical protein